MKKIILLFSLIFSNSFTGFSQNSLPWRGKACAVVLTYDDAIDQHLDNAALLLDSLGLKATFYITAYSISMQKRLDEWRKLASKGFELGNHTLYHPCMGGPGREWVTPEYDLKNYTVQRMVDEARMTNLFLQSLDGKTRRTFAFTCGDMKIGDSSFIMGMKKDFVAARVVNNQMHQIREIDLYGIDCYVVNGESGAQLIDWVKQAESRHSLLVILFHGVGGGNALNVSLSAHREFLLYLKQNEKDIMLTTMIETADYIRSWQMKNQ